MINIPSLIAGAVAKLLDTLKIQNPRIFAIVGAVVIALENTILSGILPFSDKIPVIVTETIVLIAAIFLNGRSFTLSTAAPAEGTTVGTWLDQQLAILIEKFKAGSLTAFTVIQIVFAGFKFYVITDPTLDWGQVTINVVLSFLMLFTAPKTKPILAKMAESKAKWVK